MRTDARVLFGAALASLALVAAPARGQATISISITDGSGEGLNDTTAVAPVGGNNGTTLGAQRLNALRKAADLWAARLSSGVEIRIEAHFDDLDCSATSAVLAAAGPNLFLRDFSGAPLSNTWYPQALADALSGSDNNPGEFDIEVIANSRIGTTCSFPRPWYYGLDGNTPSNRLDLVTIFHHELAHGLGFLSAVNESTGARLQGRNDIFSNFLVDDSTGKSWGQMTDTERAASAKNGPNLLWSGTRASAAAAAGGFTAGIGSGSRPRIYAPNPVEEGSSISHWDVSLTPSELLEPLYTGPLFEGPLTVAALRDLGWGAAATANAWLLPSSARAPGVNNAFFTTNLDVANTGSSDATFTIKFLGNNRDGNVGPEQTFTLAAGRSNTYADVLSSVFGLAQDFGAIRISSVSSSLAVVSQTSTPGFGGTFGQSVPAFADAELIRAGSSKTILGIREDGGFRTNLILANGTNAAIDVAVQLFDTAGFLIGSRTVSLPALGMTQVSRVVRDLGVSANVTSARLVLSTPTAGGAFAAYAAAIDNVTNDPRTLLPR